MIPLEVRLKQLTSGLDTLTPVQQSSRLPIRWPELQAPAGGPVPTSTDIRKAMASFLGVDETCVAVCPHPDDALRVCAELVITEDVTVPVIQPAPWSHTRVMAAAGAVAAPHLLDTDFHLPYDDLAAILDTRPPIFMAGYPWDPIGLKIDGEWMLDQATSIGETLFVLDAAWSVQLHGWPDPTTWPLNLVAIVSIAPLVGGDWFHGAALIGHPQLVEAVAKMFVPMGLPRTLRPIMMHTLEHADQAWDRWTTLANHTADVSAKLLELGWLQLHGVGPWLLFQPDAEVSEDALRAVAPEPALLSLKDYPMIHDWWALMISEERELSTAVDALERIADA